MNHYIKILALFAFLFGVFQEGRAQSSPCFPNLPVTGAYANKPSSTSTSPNKDRVFWLTWGATYAESQTEAYKYGRAGRTIGIGSKSYGSIDLGGGRYMCVEAEIMTLTVGGGTTTNELNTYIPGTYAGDFLANLYNIGGSGSNNRMASGMIAKNEGKTVNIVIKIKAKTGGEAVKLRGLVMADAESLASGENIIVTGDGNWSVAEIKKGGSGTYNIRKQNNTPSGTQSISFLNGNNNAGAIAFVNFKNTAYIGSEYAIEVSSQFTGGGNQAIAIGLLTSGYDFGDAPASYGKPIHLIDDIDLGNDGIPVNNTIVNINAAGYNPGLLTYSVRRFLGSTAPDPDIVDMFSLDAKGDDNSGNAGVNEEDAWPVEFRQIADKNYMPGKVITVTIPYKKALANDIISGWIDFNLNGTFEPSEISTKTITADGDGSVTLTWTVPATRVNYSTYARLRYFGRNQIATSPIGNTLNGEVEDHRIYIMTPGITNPMLPSKSKQ